MVETESKPDSKNQMLDLHCATHSFRNEKEKLKRFHVTAKQQWDSRKLPEWNKEKYGNRKGDHNSMWILPAYHTQGTDSVDKTGRTTCATNSSLTLDAQISGWKNLWWMQMCCSSYMMGMLLTHLNMMCSNSQNFNTHIPKLEKKIGINDSTLLASSFK